MFKKDFAEGPLFVCLLRRIQQYLTITKLRTNQTFYDTLNKVTTGLLNVSEFQIVCSKYLSLNYSLYYI